MMNTIARTIGLLLIAGLFSSPVLAQQFQRAIGTPKEERAEWIARTSDGGSIICGFQGPTAYIVKLDSLGATQWDTQLTGGGFEFPNRVLETTNGDYVIAGETSNGAPGFGISLIRLNSSGGYLWSRCYDGTAFAGGSFGNTGLDETSDGGFILCGRKQNSGQGSQDGVLIKTDSSGILQWQKIYWDFRFGVNAFSSFADVHQTSDGGYIVTGYTSSSPAGSRDTILMKTDANGNASWLNTYGVQQHSEGGFNCEPAANGDYLVTGFTKEPGEGGGTFLLRTDSTGNLLIYRTYRFFNGGHGMHETPTGNVIISGNALDFATFEDASLLNVDAAGNLNWCMAYGDGGSGQEFGEAVTLMPGNGFQLAAWTNVFGSGNFDIYTVRTDNLGVSTCNERPHEPLVGDDKPPVTPIEFEFLNIQFADVYQLQSDSPNWPNLNLCEEEGGCVPPPQGIVAWYPMDDSQPNFLADELAFNNQGAPFNGTFPGPGFVNEAACMDGINDYYQAPNAPQINFGTGDFSMDAWVMTTANAGVRVILDKRTQDQTGTTGYSLFTVSGNLGFQLADGTGSNTCGTGSGASCTNFVSTGFVADGQWHLVAVTVDRDGNGTFYVDGSSVGTFDATLRPDSVTNTSPLRIGARSFENTGNWLGCIDEVELFDRVLSADEILGLFNAGPDGKCRDSCHAKWDVPFCAGDDSVITTATICNNGTAPAMYSLTLAGLPASVCGNINGPTSFTILDPLPVTVNPGDCATVNISIDRPAGMTAAGLIGCFETAWTNLSNGFTTRCIGSVIDRRDYCAVFDDNPIGVIDVLVGTPVVVPVVVSNPQPDSVELEVQIISTPSNMDANAPANISLDGLPPGEPIVRVVKIPPDGEDGFDVEVRLLDHEPFVFYDIILMVAGKDGTFQPSDSLGFRTLVSDAGCSDSLGDVNGDGIINLLDVGPFIEAISSGQYVCEADCNEDGAVNLLDIEPFILLLGGG